MEKALVLLVLLAGSVVAQDHFEISVDPFQFGKKATMKQCPKLQLSRRRNAGRAYIRR
jgi:hypothetical protein